MISYYDGQLADIMPDNITKEAEVQALSFALQQGTRLLYKYAQRLYIYSNLDGQPEEIIDLLAVELRTQYYHSDMDLETKRRLVKNTIIWYMTAGTPAAVEELVEAVFGEGAVKEWFEYGDDPYYFKIITNALLTPDITKFFGIMLRRVKNTRSHLRAIEIHRVVEQDIFAGIGQRQSDKSVAIVDGYSVSRDTKQTVCAGVGFWQITRQNPAIDGFTITNEPIIRHIYSGMAAMATKRQAAIRENYEMTGQSVRLTGPIGVGGWLCRYKSAVIREGLIGIAYPVKGDIKAGTAASSRYKNITMAGGEKDATTIS